MNRSTHTAKNGTPTLSGAAMLVRLLEAQGVEIIFGHPGGAVIKIYDEIERLQPSFEHVLVRHEQGGTHAAEGYAKATGRVGTVLVTSGPGATNCVTGIADAQLDSVPIVVFTGQVPTGVLGTDAFQETDIIGVTRSITKHSIQVRDVAELASVVPQAYELARTGRPGPVVVDLPKDVLAAEAAFEMPAPEHFAESRAPDDARVRQAADLINNAAQPLLYAGGGVVASGAAPQLAALARMAQIPVTTTLHGPGAFPEDDELSVGMLGMHGTWYANQAVQNCDLLIALGARFDDRVTGNLDEWAPHARVIHIDIDPACHAKIIPAECSIVADVSDALEALHPRIDGAPRRRGLSLIAEWKAECPLRYERSDSRLRAQYVIEQLREKTGGDAVLVSDVGQHQMWVAQYSRFVHPRTHITSGGLGTMGFGLPAAMGAAFGLRNAGSSRPVICVSGDGGFLMNAQELGVAAAHRLPLKVIVLNNSYLGMVRQWQDLFHERRFSHTDLAPTNPDFVRLAEAFGCAGMRADHPRDVDDVLDAAWDVTDRPVLMEFEVIQEEMVFPMVPAGAATGDMILEPAS